MKGTNKVNPNAILLKELQRQMMKYSTEDISIAIVWMYLMSPAASCYKNLRTRKLSLEMQIVIDCSGRSKYPRGGLLKVET